MLAVVDWGTSHLRIWLLDRDGTVIAESKSADGMSATGRDEFKAVLEKHLRDLAIGEDVPVIMCGMVGARQGWVEADYVPVPARLEKLGDHAVRVPHERRDIRILPGLSKADQNAPDVMRGEETQLLGLFEKENPGDGESTICCLPGTHSKWVLMSGGKVLDCLSFMTGDMFAALSHHTVLKHSVGEGAFDAGSGEFQKAVSASLNSPADILARLFSIRPAGLLHELDNNGARARLSGYLIGQEIAGAKARLAIGGSVALVGGGYLGALYKSALEAASINCRIYDGEELVIAGALKAAAAIWNLDNSKGA